jgi:hypothetical protein
MNTFASKSKQKQAAVVVDPLRDAGILGQVFKLLPGSYLFLGAVCTEWKAAYATLEDQQLCSVSLYDNDKLVTCCCKTTCYSAAVASPATARLAHSCGLSARYKDINLQVIVGLHADMQTLAALRELGMRFKSFVTDAAALSGRLDILQRLATNDECAGRRVLSHHAARSGSIAMLQWLKAKGCAFYHHTCAGAAWGGHLAALQHLRSERCDWKIANIACYAAASGTIEVIDWLRQQQGVDINAATLVWAAGAGHTAMCAHLRSLDCGWDSTACASAAVYGHVYTLQWLRSNGCPWDVHKVCTNAARDGATAILDYVVEQGEVLDAELLTHALNAAGSNSQLQAAQWLRQRGALWPAVLRYGERADSVKQWSGESLAWARAEGCTAPTTAL